MPDAVAKKLGTDESGRQLAEHIITTTNGNTSTIAITAAEPTPTKHRGADTFATELQAVLDKKGQDTYTAARDKLQARLDTLNNQVNDLYRADRGEPAECHAVEVATAGPQTRSTPPPTTPIPSSRRRVRRRRGSRALQKAESIPIDKSEYDARLSLGATSRNNLSGDSSSSNSSTQDQIVTSSSSSSPSTVPSPRGVLGAFLGFLLGIGLAFVTERLDSRIRTRAEAEEAFALPVLAEVPQIKKSQQRDNEIVASTAPLSRFAEAYRAIRSSLLFTRAAMAAEEQGTTLKSGNGAALGGTLFEPEHDEPLVVMVTSSSPSEGKTTTTANLAAVFAEAGSSVLVVNCDFRRPTIHRYFGVPDEPRRVHETNIPGVKIVTNVLTDPASNPAQVVAAQRQVVAAARGRFDVILLDTAPILTANDAVELVVSADILVLVARMGVTKTDAAQRSIELLNRLDVAIAGVVLVGAAAASNDYYYYYQPGRVSAPGVGAPRRPRPPCASRRRTATGPRAPRRRCSSPRAIRARPRSDRSTRVSSGEHELEAGARRAGRSRRPCSGDRPPVTRWDRRRRRRAKHRAGPSGRRPWCRSASHSASG